MEPSTVPTGISVIIDSTGSPVRRRTPAYGVEGLFRPSPQHQPRVQCELGRSASVSAILSTGTLSAERARVEVLDRIASQRALRAESVSPIRSVSRAILA